MTIPAPNPHRTLGVSATATSEEVRAAYLSLVRQHPPDRDAEKFHEIHRAYQMLCDPLVQARSLLNAQFDHDRPPDLETVVADAESQLARLPKLVLLALGNQE